MFHTRRISLTKPILLAILLASIVLCACIGPRGWPGAQVNGDVLFTSTMDGRVLALDPDSGTTIWEWKPTVQQGGGIMEGNVTGAFLSCSRGGVGQFKAGYFYGSPVVMNGTVYVGYETGVVYAIDAATGVEVWEHDVKSNIAAGLAFADNIVYVASSNGKVSALDAGNGSLSWEFSSQNEVRSAPAVANGFVYFGSFDHNLYALNANNGTRIWSFETGGEIASTPLVVDGVIYVGSFDSKFYAIDDDSGTVKWVLNEAGNWFWSQALYDDGIVYACSIDDRVYALDAGNGTFAWAEPFDASSPLKSSPAIAGGVLVVASEEGKVFGLDLKTGQEKWINIDLGTKVLSPLCTDGRIVYINGQNNRIYALEGDTGQLAWTVSLAK
jgi:outer membrane protein assembly factor BamB